MLCSGYSLGAVSEASGWTLLSVGTLFLKNAKGMLLFASLGGDLEGFLM